MTGTTDRSKTGRRAFTLIELVISLAILSLLSLIVFTRSTLQLQTSQVTSFVQRISTLDRTVRVAARKSGTEQTLRISPLSESISRETERSSRSYSINAPTAIRRLRVRTDRVWSNSPTEITVARNGRSESYAIRLELADETMRYIGFVGTTGQFITTVDEKKIDVLFK